jgi:ABC-type antimicrobial peptide transport system permease subunit
MLGKSCLGCFMFLVIIMFLGCLFLGFITKIVFALSVGVFILTAYIIGIIFMAFVIYNAIKFLLTS